MHIFIKTYCVLIEIVIENENLIILENTFLFRYTSSDTLEAMCFIY